MVSQARSSFYGGAVTGQVNEWLYICSNCGHRVTDGVAFRGECPECYASSWLCHWINQGNSSSRISGFHMPNRMKTQNANLSQTEGPEMLDPKRDKSTFPPQKKRPGPRPLLLNDLVSKLAGQGLSSRGIARELNKRGIRVSYKTIQRRLQGQLSQ
jgi:hypothetical protein